MVRIRVLGHLEIELDGQTLQLPPSRRARALLAWLATHPGRHSGAQLAAQLWPYVSDSSARTKARGSLA